MPLSVVHAWKELDVARYKAELYRMWHAGYGAGLTHEQVFAAAGSFRRSPTVDCLRLHLLEAWRRRESLETAVRARPELFVSFEAALLELGEESGHLEEVLRLLGDYFQGEHRMVLWVKKKLSYPMINAVAAIFIVAFPILYFGNTMGYLLTVMGELAVAGTAGGSILLAAARAYRRRPKVVLARLCRALAIGVEAGLSLDRVVDVAVAAAESPELAPVRAIPARILQGQPLAETFERAAIVPAEMLGALRVAEETGNYRDTLRKLADLYHAGFS